MSHNIPRKSSLPKSDPGPIATGSDQESWEDLPTTPTVERKAAPKTPEASGRIRTTPRTRRIGATRTEYASTPKRQRIQKQIILPSSSRRQDTSFDASEYVWPVVRYIADVFGAAILLLRKPLSFLLFLWFLALILAKVSSILHAAFRPICILPGFSSLNYCNPRNASAIQWADYPKLVEVQTKTFDQLLDSSAAGSELSLDVKKAEMASTDLITSVRVSDLKSRDLLSESLSDFVRDARSTAGGLQKLSSKIQGSVDQIVAVNDYAFHAIESSTKDSSVTSSAIQALIPWSSRPSKEVVTRTFHETLTVLSSSIQRLTLEAHVQQANLESLEQRLSVIHSILVREKTDISDAQADVLAELWTLLGGNRKKLRKFQDNLELLKNLERTRQKALAHVVAVGQALQALSEDMEDLRERVTAPELVGEKIPIEVQVRSIKIGVERLKQGRIRAGERANEAVDRILSVDA